jgi:hypothetical protein
VVRVAHATYVEAPTAQIHIDEINDNLRNWLAGEIAADARRYAAVDTGYMATHIVVEEDGHKVTALGAGIPPNRDAPAYVEYGTRPHLIPNAFGWGITVRHPGTRAQPFLRPAAYKPRRIPPSVIFSRSSLADR